MKDEMLELLQQQISSVAEMFDLDLASLPGGGGGGGKVAAVAVGKCESASATAACMLHLQAHLATASMHEPCPWFA